MPELPEITVLARQMDKALKGRVFSGAEALQPKCLNLPPDEFAGQLSGQQIQGAYAHGKWIVTRMTEGHLLINLGMGGEVLLLSGRRDLPEKVRVVLDLEDGACLALNFWWFGYCHYADDLANHPMLAKLGPHFMALTLDEFRELLHGRRGGIKSYLLNQQRIAGIGNVYVQDPLFKAGLHPLRSIGSLSDGEIEALWLALRETLQESIDHRGSKWEQDLYGQHGTWDSSFFLVAYREGELCPVCGSIVEKAKTGSTSSYICPQCQPEDPSRV